MALSYSGPDKLILMLALIAILFSVSILLDEKNSKMKKALAIAILVSSPCLCFYILFFSR